MISNTGGSLCTPSQGLRRPKLLKQTKLPMSQLLRNVIQFGHKFVFILSEIIQLYVVQCLFEVCLTAKIKFKAFKSAPIRVNVSSFTYFCRERSFLLVTFLNAHSRIRSQVFSHVWCLNSDYVSQ